jgi:hypothetical protein
LARATRVGTSRTRIASFALSVVPKHVKPAVDVGLARQAYLVSSEAARSNKNAVTCAVSISVVPFVREKDVLNAVKTSVTAARTPTVKVASLMLRTSLRILNLPVKPRLPRHHAQHVLARLPSPVVESPCRLAARARDPRWPSSLRLSK